MSLAFYMSVRRSKWASVCCWWYAFVLLSLYNRPEIAGIRNANGIVCVHYSDSFLVVNMRLVVSEFFFLSLVLFIHRWFVCCCFLSLCVCVLIFHLLSIQNVTAMTICWSADEGHILLPFVFSLIFFRFHFLRPFPQSGYIKINSNARFIIVYGYDECHRYLIHSDFLSKYIISLRSCG